MPAAALAAPAPLSVVVSLTRDPVPEHRPCFLPTVPQPGAPFPPPGPRGLGSPASSVLWSAPIPCGPSGHASFVLRVALPPRAPVFVAPYRPDAGLSPSALLAG